MYCRFLIGLLLLTAGSLRAFEFPLEIIEHVDGSRIVIVANPGAIEGVPVWKPADGGPPLTLAALLETLRSWRARDPSLASASIDRITLKPVLHHEDEGAWYYLVRMKVRPDGEPKSVYVAVLMNGNVLPAIREPASIK